MLSSPLSHRKVTSDVVECPRAVKSGYIQYDRRGSIYKPRMCCKGSSELHHVGSIVAIKTLEQEVPALGRVDEVRRKLGVARLKRVILVLGHASQSVVHMAVAGFVGANSQHAGCSSCSTIMINTDQLFNFFYH